MAGRPDPEPPVVVGPLVAMAVGKTKDGESLPLASDLITGRAILEHRIIQIEDVEKLDPSEYPGGCCMYILSLSVPCR